MVTKHSRGKSKPARQGLTDRQRARLYRGLTVIPPPKTVEELAKEQGLWGKTFDYGALATAVWPTKKDVEEFEQHLRDIRGRPSK